MDTASLFEEASRPRPQAGNTEGTTGASSLFEEVGKVAAQVQFDDMYSENYDDNVKSLEAHLKRIWEERGRKELFKQAADVRSAPSSTVGKFRFHFDLPEGMAFDEEEITEALLRGVDDFKGLTNKVFVFKNCGQAHLGKFRLFFDYSDQVHESFVALKNERKRKREVASGLGAPEGPDEKVAAAVPEVEAAAAAEPEAEA